MSDEERHRIMRLLGEIARKKTMPCTIEPDELELAKRRDDQKKRLERVLNGKQEKTA